jgi:nanoRNase/pAp phosphatase (c-di-AMP/oligoRNAs hydrolase)
MTLDSIVEEIQNAQNIIILTHDNPDGDAIRKQFSALFRFKTIK